MPIKSLSQSSLTNFQKYSSMLAGNAAFSPSAYDLLETQVLGTAAASVTFTGLGSYTEYKHLQIRAVARTDKAASNDTVYLQFNSDTGSNYANHSLVGIGSQANSSAGASTTYIYGLIATGATEPTNAFSAAVIDILDFSSTSKNTTVRNLNNWNTNQIRLDSGVWLNTNAVTSVTLDPSSSDFIAGSRFSLYGIRGA